MRSIKAVHKAVPAPIADLITFRALPVNTINMNVLNPFIFLNHHGPQIYQPNNSGLPFGPHPHRGMETVTFILEGDIMHKDSGGYKSIISAGGVQYMSAGKGLIHAENSSEEFRRNGGRLEILQLWLNLPAKYKMGEPVYKGFQKEEIPQLNTNTGVKINVIAGEWGETKGVFESVTNVQLSTVYFENNGELTLAYPPEQNIFFYVIRGQLKVNGETVSGLQLVEFEHDDSGIAVKALTETILLLGSAPPLNEPIIAQGPFVMNSEDEIFQAYDDYKKGKFGTWDE